MDSDQLMSLSNKIADLARVKAMIAHMDENGEMIETFVANGLHVPAGRADDIRAGVYAYLKVLQGELRHALYELGVNPDAETPGVPVAANGNGADHAAAFDAELNKLDDDAKPRADGLSD